MVAPSVGAIGTTVIEDLMYKQPRCVMFTDKHVNCGLLRGMTVCYAL